MLQLLRVPHTWVLLLGPFCHKLFVVLFKVLFNSTAACQEVKRVLTPSSQESQDKVTSVWSVCRIPQGSNIKDHSYVFK